MELRGICCTNSLDSHVIFPTKLRTVFFFMIYRIIGRIVEPRVPVAANLIARHSQGVGELRIPGSTGDRSISRVFGQRRAEHCKDASCV